MTARRTITARAAGALAAAALAAGSLACRDTARSAAPSSDGELWIDRGALDRGDAEVAVASDSELPQSVAGAGRVAFDDLRVQHVYSPVAGRITRVIAAPGDRVRRGAPLAALLSPDVGTAFSDLLKAQADVAQAEADLARQRRLVAAEAAPRRDLEAAEDLARRAAAELARARQRAALLRSGRVDAVTQELTLESAIDGTVIARSVSPGMEIQGAYSGGTPPELYTVGDIDRVWVLVDVAEADLSRVRVGAAATVRVAAWPGRLFPADVQWIADTLDPALRTGRVRLALDNRDHALLPEMLARVSIAAAPRRGLTIPRAAVLPIEGQTFAFVADGPSDGGRQRFTHRRIQVAPGDPADPVAVVQDGLAAGDRVVIERKKGREVGTGEVRVTARQLERSGLRVQTVGREEVADSVVAGARVAFDDLRMARVFSPVTGRIVRVLAEPGQHVRRGAPLVVIVSPDVGTAYADAVKAEADLVAARHEAARRRELFALHAGSQRDVEAAEAALRKAQAELERAGQKMRLLATGSFDAVTQEYTLRSPIDGDVVARGATPGLEVQGQWAGANTPVELFTVGSLDPLWIVGDVYEMDLPHLRPGSEVEVRVSTFPDRVFHGRIDWVSQVLDPATRTVKVRCSVANPGRLLRPEMAPVLTVALPAHGHLAVPREAVLRLGDQTIAFVAAGTAPDGQLLFRRRTVLVGEERPDGTVPILEGLVPGERVVVAGGIFLVGLL